ncbi:MAG: cytochrome c-type biosis protein CcmH [Gaiellaceae bacterium]|nr:cytochrome c-type biosis protein CcmH [Gaiellaceae bacterium]
MARRLLLVVLAALLLAGPAAASERHPTLAELESEIMCPECKQPLSMSDSALSNRIEAYIARRIAAGDTKSEIKDKLVAQFGPQILADSPNPWTKLLPLLAVGLAILIVAAAAWHWARKRGEPDERALDPELDSAVDEALARYDA